MSLSVALTQLFLLYSGTKVPMFYYVTALLCFVPFRYVSLIRVLSLGGRPSTLEFDHIVELGLRPGMTISDRVAIERLLSGPMGKPIAKMLRTI